ncbi:ATP-binding cassette domain-containing protein [Winogradskyella litorisediminis]|uniref:ATP-binding cassette domain-containing protein n=1 Tax=Winogradskyella litorisediminis TaxID=1156618 RepID=A0ABW3N9E9_9FLAO
MAKGLFHIHGSNFSGRSEKAKNEAEAQNNNISSSSILIREIPLNSISGIMPTVEHEILLHSSNTSDKTLDEVNEIIEYYDFHNHYCKNPFDLSGGEQTLLVIINALLLEPKKLFIDLTLEQLNSKWVSPLIENFFRKKFEHIEIYIIDNRFEYYDFNLKKIQIQINPEKEYKYKFNKCEFFEEGLTYHSSPSNIKISNLSFSYYGSENVFNDLSLELNAGNIYHLKGSNGAGKSTLGKILTGLLKCKTGNIIVNGSVKKIYKYPSKYVSYNFQNPDEQLFSMTVLDEVLKVHKKENLAASSRRQILIKMFGLDDVSEVNPAELPFVMRKRLSIASSIALDKAWYIFDEPTLGQDDEFTEFFISILEFLNRNNKGVILISHSLKLTSKIKHIALDLDKIKDKNEEN